MPQGLEPGGIGLKRLRQVIAAVEQAGLRDLGDSGGFGHAIAGQAGSVSSSRATCSESVAATSSISGVQAPAVA